MPETNEKKNEGTRPLNAQVPADLMIKLNAEAYEKNTSMTAIIIKMLQDRYKK